MHIDAGELENGSLIKGDLCIIGAGAAGISIALDWIDTPYNVILLEGGGFEVDTRMQDLYKGKSIGQRYYPLQSSRLHYFGGTTGHWAGFCTPFDPIDFKKRDWVPYSGWPIEFDELNPYYKRAGEIVELPSDHFDLDYWKGQDPDLIPLPLNKDIVCSKLWQFSPPTRFGKRYRDAIVKARNISLYTHANVTNLIATEEINGIKELQVQNVMGKTHRVQARYFVLACGAIQNARVLLSSDKQIPEGLGNQNGLVGRFFMEHLEVVSAELHLPDFRPMKLYRPWTFAEVDVRAELAVSEKQQEVHKILNGTASLNPKTSEERTINIESFSEDAVAFVDMWNEMEKFRSKVKTPKKESYTAREFEFFTRMEQSPNPYSRVLLDREKDELGMPRMNLDWQLTALDKRSVRKLYEIIGIEIGKAGVGRVKMMDWLEESEDAAWPSTLGGGWHHMGTTRMSHHAEEGVVDPNCKVHGIDNLFVAGSSCFPTAGAANPTLTLIALSLRLSNHLKKVYPKNGVAFF
jgi:choline dehydrogenase-like flavoprotein